MDGFEKYNQEVRKFESSKLYRTKFRRFLQCMRERSKSNPAVSFVIETGMQVSGADVRKMVQNARRMSLPVASAGNGYFYAKSKGELRSTIEHLKERRNSLSYTISQLELAFIEDDSEQKELEL